MLSLYPSNRLEHLAVLLDAVLKQRQGSVLSSDIVLVESQGMQHWLNLHLAQSQRIAMNLQYPMPTRFIWDICRRILGSDTIPQQSPYRREVLAWRIDQIFYSPTFIQSPEASAVNRYWLAGNPEQSEFKRYQLATQLADLFEQYMLYRPDWLQAWEEKRPPVTQLVDEQWQAAIWRRLVEEIPLHPPKLMQQAKRVMQQHQDKLPDRIMVFAINTMAAQNVEFLAELSNYVDIHWFYLNPCVDYWGDIVTDRSRAKMLRQQQAESYLGDDGGNRLLANLGQQGRDLFNLLNDKQSTEISAFDAPWQPGVSSDSTSVLKRLQQDILTMHAPVAADSPFVDDSVQVVSCHTALREIQVLHDRLLHLFNQDPGLKPSDVVVMCPAIEDYAPYVEAVFQTTRGESNNTTGPRLPCSLADRAPLDSEPVINAFLELLHLPDSRFSVNALLEYLRLPSVQQRFDIQHSDLDTLNWWLQEAAIHWGLDANHQAGIAGVESLTGTFSWQWGLKRLLTGMLQADEPVLVGEILTLPHVEGQRAYLLGQLLRFIECLNQHSRAMARKRSVEDWQRYLLTLRDDVFAQQDDDNGLDMITQVIAEFAQTCAEASLTDKIGLDVMRHFLSHHFSKADAGNHFMTGQVTFCSMVPMRSIPFRVVAVLGLNDGEFPRLDTVSSIDLMRQSPRRLGDRSRRGDDRYLFLEALISARDVLYLSYQGRHVKDNSERQPSLVLAELQDYLRSGYGWQFDPDVADAQLYQAPIHPFSEANYQGSRPSFDQGWYQVLHRQIDEQQSPVTIPTELSESVDVETLCRCFANPLKYFANQILSLDLQRDTDLLEDNEPFEGSYLDRYQSIQAFTQALADSQDVQQTRNMLQLSGKMPDTPLTGQLLDEWQSTAALLSDALSAQYETKTLTASCSTGQLISTARWTVQGIQLYRPGSLRSQDKVSLLLHHLVGTVSLQGPLHSEFIFLKPANDESGQDVWRASIEPLKQDHAQSLLEHWLSAYRQCLREYSLSFHAELAGLLIDKTTLKFAEPSSQKARMAERWSKALYDENNRKAMMHDPYFQWFYPYQLHVDEQTIEALHSLYLPLFSMIGEEAL